MPDDDWALAQNTVDVRNEERLAGSRGYTDRGPDGRYRNEDTERQEQPEQECSCPPGWMHNATCPEVVGYPDEAA